MKAKVYITLKAGVLDPQGKAVVGALESMDFDEVKDVRIGKYLELIVDGDSPDAVKSRVEEMCEKLLANTVMESYRVEVG